MSSHENTKQIPLFVVMSFLFRKASEGRNTLTREGISTAHKVRMNSLSRMTWCGSKKVKQSSATSVLSVGRSTPHSRFPRSLRMISVEASVLLRKTNELHPSFNEYSSGRSTPDPATETLLSNTARSQPLKAAPAIRMTLSLGMSTPYH